MNPVVIHTKKGDYTLEYTRETEQAMERRGFRLEEISTRPMTMLPMLFSGAFLAHHKKMKTTDIEKLWEGLPDKSDLCERLAELYSAPMNAYFDDPEGGDDEGNGLSWE